MIKYFLLEHQRKVIVPPDEIDLERDQTLYPVFDGDQKLLRSGVSITAKRRQMLKDRDIRQVRVYRDCKEWVTQEQAKKLQGIVLEEKQIDPATNALLDGMRNLHTIGELNQMINKYVEMDLPDDDLEQLQQFQEQLDNLLAQEKDVAESILEIKDEKARNRIFGLLESRNPSFDLDTFPRSARSVVKKVSKFIDELREVKSSLTEFLIELDDPPDMDEVEATEIDGESEETSPLQSVRNELKNQSEQGNPLVTSLKLAEECLQSDDYLLEPDEFSPAQSLYSRVDSLLNQVIEAGTFPQDEFEELFASCQDALTSVPEACWLLPERNPEHDALLGRALSRVVIYLQVWPESMKEDEGFEAVLLALMFCDLGMLEVPETSWRHSKKAETYEKDDIEKHIAQSCDMLEVLEDLPFKQQVISLVKQHHVRPNGRGYPSEITQADWDQQAKKIALCDVYDALSSKRPWRTAYSPEKSLDILTDEFDGLDPELLDHFVNRMGHYPSGLAVRLDDGDPAIVVRQTDDPANPEIYRPQGGRTENPLDNTTDLRSAPESIEAPIGERSSRWKLRRTLVN